MEKLPSKNRAFLAERQKWADEAIHRRDEVRSGKVKTVPAAEAYRRIERLLAK